MRLTEYLTKYEISKNDLCERANISTQTLFRLMNGNTVELPTAARLEIATYGKVSCLDIYKEFMQDLEKAKK